MATARRRTGEFEVRGRPTSWVRRGVMGDRPLVILAHGAGAPYTHPFMEETAEGLVSRGMTVACFHFPYMERQVREQRRRPPDPKPLLLETWDAMLKVASRWKRRGPLFMAGKSMGGRMASMWLSDQEDPPVQGAIYLGYPLHAPGKSDRLRADHLPEVPVPQLFVSGTRDPLCDLDKLRPVLRRVRHSQLFVVEGGDHSLAVKRTRPMEAAEVWLDEVARFVARCTGPVD